MSFFQKLEERATAIDSLLCIGLDPHTADLAEPSADAAKAFCLNLVESTHEIALAYKPNIAFFEVFGGAGIDALKQVIAAIPEGIPVILDAKRGDISSTADAYAQSAFEVLKADAVTINSYLGHDSIAPFIQNPENGAFLLCQTSNPGAQHIQNLQLVSGKKIYEQVAALAKHWNTQENLGLVVGATHPAAMQNVRREAPDLWILAPGLGAQGGDLEKTIHFGLRADGLGLIFPVSRGISRADDPHRAALEFRDKINAARENWIAAPPHIDPEHFHQLAGSLFKAGCVKYGEFTLKSGLQSPIYIDLRLLASFPQLLFEVARAYSLILESLTFDRLAPIPYAALPIGTAISLQGNWPMVYPRKETKEYGTRATIEGEFHPGERAAVIDDLTTTGSSKFEAIEKLIAAGLEVQDIVVLIDRQSGAVEALKTAGFRLHSIFTLRRLSEMLLEQQLITSDQHRAVLDFLNTGENR
jgi:uridine monophosphate synthetase